jgi:hypothetical protein
MKSKLAVDAADFSRGAMPKPASEQFERDGESVFWCASCLSYRPRHTCEWKPLAAIVLGAAVVCVIGIWFLFSGLTVR